MIQFAATILQFAEQGEKTGWTYIEVPEEIAQQLKPGVRKTFRVKGKLDHHVIHGIALLPMGGGSFIMALNAAMRKAIGKRKGANIKVQLQADDKFSYELSAEMLECLQDEPTAYEFFKTLTKGHQAYFIKWINEAKTEATKTRRMAQMVTALAKKQDYGSMLRSLKQNGMDRSASLPE